MNSRNHIKVFATALFVWLAFWITGLPDYYKQYSDNSILRFELLLLLPIEWLIILALRRVHQKRRLIVSCWMAFHFTFPLAFYDWLYCGMYLGYGLNFFFVFWYLTVYYIIPWILFPISAALLNVLNSKSNIKRNSDLPI